MLFGGGYVTWGLQHSLEQGSLTKLIPGKGNVLSINLLNQPMLTWNHYAIFTGIEIGIANLSLEYLHLIGMASEILGCQKDPMLRHTSIHVT